MALEMVTPKIVFVDIDGTLIDDEQRCPPSASEAIAQARRNGHFVYICSGRQRSTIPGEITDIGFDGIVASSGAHIEKAGVILHKSALAEGVVEKVCAYLDERRTPYMLEGEKGPIANAEMFRFLRERQKAVPPGSDSVKRLEDRLALFESTQGLPHSGIAKITFAGCSDAFIKTAAEAFAEECDLFRMYMPMLGCAGGELTTKGIHKGFAVRFVAAYHGIDLADTIAIGDSGNDSKMVEEAGLGIAMGNGDDDLKRIASHVTACLTQGGLAQAFRYAGLI